MITQNQVRDLIGSQLVDSNGEKIGKIGQIFLDDQTGQPEWATVNTGFFGSNETFVPLADAESTGSEVRVPYDKERATRMTTLQDVQAWRGQKAIDANGDKVGTIDEIYLDRQSGEPEWATVSTGLFGSRTSFVPIRDASGAGNEVRLPYTKDQIKDAPNVDADGELSVEEEQRLYQHYGRGDYGEWSGEDRTEGLGLAGDRDDRFSRDDDLDAGRRGTVGHDTSGPTTDDAMTRSEEELRVGTQRRETGRARLRKYVVTEEVTQTVPVTREEVRIEREPITDANVGDAMSGPEISEEEHEVVLHAEEPVVEKRTVPKERVRLDKDTVSEERTVSEEVRKERIDTEGAGEPRDAR